MSNAGSLLRLGCSVACIAGIAACAQGIQSPGTENLTFEAGAGAFSSAGSSAISLGGATSSAGSPAQGGALGGAGRGGASSSSGGKGGATGSGGKGGATGTAGTAGSGTAGAGTGPQGCGHPQPGNMGPTLKTNLEGTNDSIYFSAEILNPDDRAVNVSDLKLRYYLVLSDLGMLTSDFFAKQIKTASITKELDGTPTVSFQDKYFEISFAGSSSTLGMGESLVLKVHTHNGNYKTHDQTLDYSYNPSTSLVPWCNVILYDQGPLAWGTLPP